MTMADRLNTATAAHLAERLAARQATSEAILDACLARIAARDRIVKAWARLDEAGAVKAARAADRARRAGKAPSPLAGIPVAVKDVIDTADMATEYGSPTYARHRPRADAACVAALREAGAVILGKTRTTEFAGAHPTVTTNPHDKGHTPGGSSSGSAAAVADFMVPLALGTQTQGSTIRPASYCGIVGFKPTFDLLPFAGIKQDAHSLDTLGLFGRAVADVRLLAQVLLGGQRLSTSLAPRPRFAVIRGPNWPAAAPETAAALDQAAAALAGAGADVTELPPLAFLGPLLEANKRVAYFEMARNLAHERRVHPGKLSKTLRAMLEAGASTSFAEYRQALDLARRGRVQWAATIDGFDAALTPAATGEAPRGLASTGDTNFNRAWTLLHVPCLALPYARGPNGLPVGLQLVGRAYEDGWLLDIGEWAERALAARPFRPAGSVAATPAPPH
jgi:amidase